MSLVRRLTLAVGALFAALTLLAAPALAAPSKQDTAWMVAAHQGNLAEIAAGKAAQEQAATEDVKRLGAMFIKMHTALDADLTAAAGKLGVSLPGAPTPKQKAELAAVAAHDGKAFDTAWIAQQLAAHQMSKANGQKEIANGDDATVVKLAKASAPVIQQHLDELAMAADTYGVPKSVPSGTGGQAAQSPMLLGGVLIAGGALATVMSVVLVSRRRTHA